MEDLAILLLIKLQEYQEMMASDVFENKSLHFASFYSNVLLQVNGVKPTIAD